MCGGTFCFRPSSLSSPPPPCFAALLCALPSCGQARAQCRVSVKMRVHASAVGRSWRSSRGTVPPSMRGEVAQQRGELMRAWVSATGSTWRACACACKRAGVMRNDFTQEVRVDAWFSEARLRIRWDGRTCRLWRLLRVGSRTL